jgi:ferredoxin-NADP reductase
MSTFQQVRIDRIEPESATAKSFYLVPETGGVVPHRPGQHLPIRLSIPGLPSVRRCYTLSDCWNPNHYRLTIKREEFGLVSKYLNGLECGDFRAADRPSFEVALPSGRFHIDLTSDQPVALIAGGIGITPMIAMLNALARAQPNRVCHMFYGVRDGSHHAFASHLTRLKSRLSHLALHTRYSRPRSNDRQGHDYDEPGRIDVEGILSRLSVGPSEYQYYVCGPRSMMADVIDGLSARGVDRNQLHSESFGSHSATPEAAVEIGNIDPGSANGLHVVFARSGRSVRWRDDAKTLLQFAEANGIEISSGCLYGDCGTCLTRLLDGEVVYNHPTGISPDVGTCLPCSCRPATTITLDA